MKPFYLFGCLSFFYGYNKDLPRYRKLKTVIIFPDTENIAATYPSSLNGNGDFDVVYLSFQNTSTQT